LLVTLVLAPAAFPQNHQALIISGRTYFRFDLASGRPATLATLPWNGYVSASCMDVRNRDFVSAINFPSASPNPLGWVIHVGRTGKVLTTVTGLPPTLGGILPARHGDYFVIHGGYGWLPPGAYRVDLASHVTTLPNPGVVGPMGMTRDIHTGDIILLDPPHVHRVTPDWRFLSTLAVLPIQTQVWGRIVQHVATGNFYVPEDRVAGILEITPSGAVRTLSPSSWHMTNTVKTISSTLPHMIDVVADRASAARPRLLARDFFNTALLEIELSSLSLRTVATAPPPGPLHLDRSRNLTSRSLGAGKWEIGIHHASGAGKSYVIGLSASGVWPGVGLPDGRKLPLNLDSLVQLSVTGQLAPAFTGNAGTLSPTGDATAVLDISPWPQLNGVPVWIGAVILDPLAPIGIDLIPDPMVLVL